MERSRNFKVFGILCLMVSVIAVSFAYSALTHTLKIEATSQTALRRKAEWKIEFEHLSRAIIKGKATEVSKPKITSPTTISGYQVSFQSPGEEVSYTFDVTNKGTLDAVVSSIQITNPHCIGSDIDCRNVLKNIKYSLTYEDGSEIKIGDMLGAKKNNFPGLNSKKLKLSISYSKDALQTEIPMKEVILKNVEAVILFEQSYLG